MNRRRLGAWANRALPGLWCLVLGFVLTWPMVLRPGSAALGSQHGDGMKHLWTLWWMRSSVWDEGRFPFETLRVNYPVGMDLYPIEPLNGLMAVFLPWIDVVTLSNLLVLANLTLTGLAAYFLGKVLTGSRMAGLVSATLLEGSAIMAFFVHVGVGELNHLWWLPLGLGCLVKAHRTGEWRWFGLLSATLVGAMLSCFYLGFFLALSVLVWSVCRLMGQVLSLTVRRWERTLFSSLGRLFLQYVLAAVLAITVVWPVTQSFADSYGEDEGSDRSGAAVQVESEGPSLFEYVLVEGHGQPVTDPEHERLELGQMVERNREAHTRQDIAYGGGRYIGWFALGLSVIGLLRRPRQAWPWVVVAGTGTVFAMGTYLTIDGVVYTMDGIPAESGGQRVRLPLLWLNRALGHLAEPLNFPVRFLTMASVAVCALGALATGALQWSERPLRVLGRLREKLPNLPTLPDWSIRGRSVPKWSVAMLLLSMVTVADVMAGQQLSWPWARFTPRPAAELETLRTEPDLAVVDLGLAIRSDEENRWSALATQIAHGKALNAVPVERIEYFARDGAFFVQSLQLIQDLSPIYQNGEGKEPGECSDGVDNDGNGLADCSDESGCRRYAHCSLGGMVVDERDSFPQYREDGFYRGDFAILRDAGFGWVVVSYRSGAEHLPQNLTATLDLLMGPAVVMGPGVGAWEIPDVDYTEAELEVWSSEHSIRLVALQRSTPGLGPQRPSGDAPPMMSAPPGAPPATGPRP